MPNMLHMPFPAACSAVLRVYSSISVASLRLVPFSCLLGGGSRRYDMTVASSAVPLTLTITLTPSLCSYSDLH